MKLPVCTSEGLPEAECPITDGEPRIDRQAAALQVQQHLLSGFLRFTESVGEHILDLAGNPWVLPRYFRIVVHAAYSLLAKGR